MAREGVGVARGAAPNVGVSRRHDDAGGIGPVVVQAFPDAARAFRHIGLRAALVMHLEVFVGAVTKQLRAARSEVAEPGDELLGRQGGCLVKVDFSLHNYRSPFLFLTAMRIYTRPTRMPNRTLA